MDNKEFRKYGHELVDWMAGYLDEIRKYPVKAQTKPGEIIAQLPLSPPRQGEPMDAIIADFKKIILPGMTHWQHPGFFAYFNANNSYPSILAEMLTAAMGAQCMSWQTSPAATELEERVMEWTAKLVGLPGDFTGVIQDTASTATLCSLLSAREKYSDFKINEKGFAGGNKYAIYCSTEAHSSIEKAVKIAGFGRESLRRIDVDKDFAIIPAALEAEIKKDKQAGFLPLIMVAACGTTGSTAVDPLGEVGEICRRYDLWLHVDAAYAGTGLILPEKRWMIDGIEHADTFVFNPHKWMFTNFDCSAYFVKDKGALIRTFEILPEYLKTKEGKQVNNYRDWGIQLGRRFRALKLWFVIRHFGVEGLREKIAAHVKWARDFAAGIEAAPDFELLAPVPLSTICFRYSPAGIKEKEVLNTLNARLLEALNGTGKIYLTHTKLNGIYTIRLVIGQTGQQETDVKEAWELIRRTAARELEDTL
ncbi:MAG: aspartate aminotransferase family protein [Candidatus Aminicenantes bacterium]|nr:aspartate aminotransferase family protein [Candidatus Aminicenantes bacterium]